MSMKPPTIRSALAMAAPLALVVSLTGVGLAQEPILTVQESNLGQWQFEGTGGPPIEVTVEANVPLNFSWLAVPGGSGALIDAYRYGWDIVDPGDPFDPNWATDWQVDLLAAPTIAFTSGTHTLHVAVRDVEMNLTLGAVMLMVTPPVTLEARTWTAVRQLFQP
jgi:hypothetical protein